MKKQWCNTGGTRIKGRVLQKKKSGTVSPILTLNKKVRCPACNKRLNIILKGCQCCMPQEFFAIYPEHKIKGKK